jgi:hypothetical protein
MNALNTGWDLLLTKPYKDGGLPINGWEIRGLKTAVHVDGTLNDSRDSDRGWSVELAIPWKPLCELRLEQHQPKNGEEWRVNFSRVQWKHEIVDGQYRRVPKTKEDNWVWSPQGVIDMHRPEKWGYVQFTTAAPGTVKYQPDGDEPTRHALHQAYYAQRSFMKQHGRMARSTNELGLKGDISLQATESGFEIVAKGKTGDRWHIREDARVWKSASAASSPRAP